MAIYRYSTDSLLGKLVLGKLGMEKFLMEYYYV